MNISFEIPQDIEHELTANGADLNAEAKGAYLVNLDRQHRISPFQIGQALGLSRYETDGVLKRQGVGLGMTFEEMRAQSESLRDAPRNQKPSLTPSLCRRLSPVRRHFPSRLAMTGTLLGRLQFKPLIACTRRLTPAFDWFPIKRIMQSQMEWVCNCVDGGDDAVAFV